MGCPGGGNPIGGQKVKLLPTPGFWGGSGLSGPAALALAALLVVNICPILGSIMPTWAVIVLVATAILIWLSVIFNTLVNCVIVAIGGVTGQGLGEMDAWIWKILALDVDQVWGLVGRDGVVSGICGTSLGSAAVWKSASVMSSPNSCHAGWYATQFPIPGACVSTGTGIWSLPVKSLKKPDSDIKIFQSPHSQQTCDQILNPYRILTVEIT